MTLIRSSKLHLVAAIATCLFATGLVPALAVDEEFTPTTVAITQGSSPRTLTVSWDAPATPAGLTGYEVALYPDGNQAGELSVLPVVSASENVEITFPSTGIARGTTYQARVTAQYGSNFYTARSTTGAKAFEAPNAPSAVSAARTDSGTVEISWTGPSDNGGDAVTIYDVTCNSACDALELGSQSLSTSSTSLVLTNLDPLTSRTFSVTASNSKYTSTPGTSNSVVPFLAPSTPAALTTDVGNTVIDVSWGASTVSGATLTGYSVRLFDASDIDFETPLNSKNFTLAQLSGGRSTQFTALTNGNDYVVRVAGVAESNPGFSPPVEGSFRTSGTLTPSIVVTGVAVSPSSLQFTLGGSSQTLTATVTPSNAAIKTTTWSSSNSLVATVNSSGVVTPVGIGSATITVTTTDKLKTATASVTVTAPTVTPALPSAKKNSAWTAKKVALLLGLTVPAKATVKVKAASGMSKICKVKSGKLRMLKAGKTCKVTVTVKPKKGKTKVYKNKKILITA
ncbi:MAG: hypothetical protein F2839_03170 [Actinobacteria bacterium]|uniref:Unannotated protein n=1 Tax=freshwater metagenome TaxID=449393 RepID=A0A6J5ZBC3_9ZZZZ|nr:hypothetical protein [Actinomycetota bacterium]